MRRDFEVLADMGVTWDELVEMAQSGDWPDGPDGLYAGTYEMWKDATDPPAVDATTARLARVEAILRAHGLHEPSCPEFIRQQRQRETGTYLVPRPCVCWLTEPDHQGDESPDA